MWVLNMDVWAFISGNQHPSCFEESWLTVWIYANHHFMKMSGFPVWLLSVFFFLMSTKAPTWLALHLFKCDRSHMLFTPSPVKMRNISEWESTVKAKCMNKGPPFNFLRREGNINAWATISARHVADDLRFPKSSPFWLARRQVLKDHSALAVTMTTPVPCPSGCPHFI